MWIVALLLTYSRGGLAVAVLVVALWFIWGDERLDAFGALVAAGLPAAAVVATAFALPGITSDGESLHTRRHDGVVFGVVLAVGLLVTVVLARVCARAVVPAFAARCSPSVRSSWPPRSPRRAEGRGGLAQLHELDRGRERRRPHRVGRLELPLGVVAAGLAGVHPPRGQGDGRRSFRLTNLLYRRSSADTVTEPHDLPIQFLSEVGIVGAVLLAGTALALLRGSIRRRGPELALALMLPAYLVHSLVDVDWDYIAVSGPAFLVAGALAGRAGGERRVSAFAVLAASGAALGAFGALLLPWLGHRWSGQAQAALGQPAHAATLARRARAADPLLIDPFFTLAFVAEQQGSRPARMRTTSRRPGGSRRTPRPGRPPGSTPTVGLSAARVRQPRALHRARPVCARRRRRRHLQRVAEARQRRQGALLTQPAPRMTTSFAPCNAAGRRPSSGPTTFTCRSRASRIPSVRIPGRYITTVVA